MTTTTLDPQLLHAQHRVLLAARVSPDAFQAAVRHLAYLVTEEEQDEATASPTVNARPGQPGASEGAVP